MGGIVEKSTVEDAIVDVDAFEGDIDEETIVDVEFAVTSEVK